MKTVIYHNARCSKSRGALALLEQHGIEPEVVHYLETPPSATELLSLLGSLGLPASALVRFKEPLARELGISTNDQRSDEQWCELLAKNPALLERPVVVRGDRAAIGRPPENILAILN